MLGRACSFCLAQDCILLRWNFVRKLLHKNSCLDPSVLQSNRHHFFCVPHWHGSFASFLANDLYDSNNQIVRHPYKESHNKHNGSFSICRPKHLGPRHQRRHFHHLRPQYGLAQHRQSPQYHWHASRQSYEAHRLLYQNEWSHYPFGIYLPNHKSRMENNPLSLYQYFSQKEAPTQRLYPTLSNEEQVLLSSLRKNSRSCYSNSPTKKLVVSLSFLGRLLAQTSLQT